MTRRAWGAALATIALTAAPAAQSEPSRSVIVGSKAFTESVILGEMLAQLGALHGVPTEHRRELGGTRILFDALRRGDIDAYVEYVGTLTQELSPGPAAGLDARLAPLGLAMRAPLGFNNTYAIGMKPGVADRLGITRISDLRAHPQLAFGFGNEFLERGDGWPALRDRYGLPQRDVRGLDHDLAYRALDAGHIAATDLYSTDAEIRAYGLRVLADDLRHFPAYHAVVLYRTALAAEAPAALDAWRQLEGRIDEPAMIALNARVKIDRAPEAEAAAGFIASAFDRTPATASRGRAWRITARAIEHIRLVAVSLAAAILIGIPLGIVAAARRGAGRAILAAAGILQTIPSLALLVLMIPLLGIGTWPAVAALFLYSLLPIVRNTHQGITGVAPELRDSGRALGLPPRVMLRRIELPLASPAILAGIKTAAVINVGTATLGALVGAGGFGQPILTGVRLADAGLILEGAVPAALLALAVQWMLDGLEPLLVPRGLRLERGR